MIRRFALIAALMPAAAIAQAPAQDSSSLRGLWSDWRSLNHASVQAETRRQAAPQRTVAEARTLGDRVGRLVASGDCEGGERMAREAGDFPLVEAVRDYCRARPGAPS
jgi:hypothetical protein